MYDRVTEHRVVAELRACSFHARRLRVDLCIAIVYNLEGPVAHAVSVDAPVARRRAHGDKIVCYLVILFLEARTSLSWY